MTWRQAIQAFLRTFILENETATVATDIVTNGLTPADEAIVDAFLDTVMP